jgi:hypothetical protein
MRTGWITFPVVAAAFSALAVLVLAPRGLEAGWLLVAQDDPAMIADREVGSRLSIAVAEREIEEALAAGDADLANSFVELAQQHDIVLDPALVAKVSAANEAARSTSGQVEDFARGLVTGEPKDGVALAGTAVGDLFVVGDIRDAVREGAHLVSGEPADRVVLGLACVGIAVTAGTYASLGLGVPARVGLSIVKTARKTGRLGARFAAWLGRSLGAIVDMSAAQRILATASISEPAVAVRAVREVVKVEKAEELGRVVGDVGRIEAKAGTQAALDSVNLAEGPADMSRLAQLAEEEGGKTRAVIKLVGRAALTLSIAAFELFNWALITALALLGFAAAVKRTAERITLRAIRHRKARRERARVLAMSQLPG